jgi:putative transposase
MKNNNVVSLKQPEESSADALTELLRNGAKNLIAQAVDAELQELLNQYSHLQLDGRQAVIRNGYLPERTIQTGLGACPRIGKV